jgi:hypothetical protein
MSDFLPNNQGSLYTWAGNFSTKIGILGAGLGYSPGEITAMQTECTAVQGALDDKATAKATAKAATALADVIIRDNVSLLRGNASGIKETTTYTDANGIDLGIVGAASTFDPATYVAVITDLEINMPGQVTLSFSAAGGAIEGVNVYYRLQGSAAWIYCNRDTASPYVHIQPLAVPGQPEIREYRIRAVMKDVEIGGYSGTSQITVS